MSSDSNSEHLLCDDLLLLVGTNPLPNWVAAKMLLKPKGCVHLISTSGVKEPCKRLQDILEKKETLTVERIETKEADADVIFKDVKRYAEKLKKQNDGRKIGLNYTGGTKMMSVHANRAIREADDTALLSYIDARSLKFKFDGLPTTLDTFDEMGEPRVRIEFETLFRLHDEYGPESILIKRKAIGADSARGLAQVFNRSAGQRVWDNWCGDERKERSPDSKWRVKDAGGIDVRKLDDTERRQLAGNLGQIRLMEISEFSQKVETRLRNEGITEDADRFLREVTTGYQECLDGLKVVGGDKLEKVSQVNADFRDALEVARWLHGGWMEHYVFSQIAACQSAAQINPKGIAINLEPVNKEGRVFEVDVAALRGYQLFYLTCYSGVQYRTAKHKLFEGAERAAQLGGDEAKIALVCCIENPLDLEKEAQREWERLTQNQIRVFGRKSLLNLADQLQEWFTRKPKEYR